MNMIWHDHPGQGSAKFIELDLPELMDYAAG